MCFASIIFLISYSFYCGYTLTLLKRIRCLNFSIMSQIFYVCLCIALSLIEIYIHIWMCKYTWKCILVFAVYRVWVRIREFAKPIWLWIPTGAELNRMWDHTVLPSRYITYSGGWLTISALRKNIVNFNNNSSILPTFTYSK